MLSFCPGLDGQWHHGGSPCGEMSSNAGKQRAGGAEPMVQLTQGFMGAIASHPSTGSWSASISRLGREYANGLPGAPASAVRCQEWSCIAEWPCTSCRTPSILPIHVSGSCLSLAKSQIGLEEIKEA